MNTATHAPTRGALALQALLFLFGAYCVLALLSQIWSFLVLVVTVVAILFAVTHWFLVYDRRRLHGLYRNPVSGGFIDLVCRWTSEQAPVDASIDAPAATTASDPTGVSRTQDCPYERLSGRLRNHRELAASIVRVRRAVRGHDETVDRVVRALRGQMDLRARSTREAAQPPIGLFLLVGPPGVGKRHLAREVGSILYSAKFTLVVESRAGGDPTPRILDAVRANPYQTIVWDGIDDASEPAIQLLRRIAAGESVEDARGARVSFRHCFVLLISTRAASLAPGRGGGTTSEPRLTEMLDVVTRETALSARLVSLVQEIFLFESPDLVSQAQVVCLVAERECAKYSLELQRIDPSFIVRELRAIDTTHGFGLLPGRIAQRLKRPILRAIENEDRFVRIP